MADATQREHEQSPFERFRQLAQGLLTVPKEEVKQNPQEKKEEKRTRTEPHE